MPALQSFASANHFRFNFANGQIVVTGQSCKLVGIDEAVQKGLGISSQDWCMQSIQVPDKQVSPCALAQLSFPGQLSDFVHTVLQVYDCFLFCW